VTANTRDFSCNPGWRAQSQTFRQREKAKTGSKVCFSRLRRAGLTMRDSMSSFVAVCKSKEALRSVEVFVISPPS